MATPVTFPTPKQIVGANKETTQGTPVITAPVFSFPIDSQLFELKPTWLDDQAYRQSMGDIANRIQGPLHEEFTFTGPAFLDTLPLLINNILGDITSTGTGPTSHAMSLLNSGGAQPGSLTFLTWEGMPATSSIRSHPGACLSELTISGNADSALITYEAKGMCWPGAVLGSSVAFTPSAVIPQATWRYAVGLGGTASASPNKTIRDFSLTITRALRVENTMQNSQNPYIIQRGQVGITGSLTCTVPSDETFLAYLIANTQPQLQIIGSVGATTTAYGLQIDMQNAAFDTDALKTDEEALGYSGTIVGIENSTNAGASGGLSPIKITVTNQTASGSY